ncbi:hypothetical protein RBB77_21375 [Tunturibacter psychrotolerans]|uniref:Uncharacterized protein n=1 Tax=Tunturiibacter psychrotolerans TaxID=3069686 RepID=A0AAU7ZPT6_9BACT
MDIRASRFSTLEADGKGVGRGHGIARITVLKDELFETADSRQAMVARRFGLPPGSILDYAVTHEMGHAICGEYQDNLADKYGFDLRRGIAPTCATDRKRSSSR